MTERRYVLALTGLRAEGAVVRALSRPHASTGIARRVTDVVEFLAVCGAGLGDGALVSPRFPQFTADVALRAARDGVPCFGVVDLGDDQGERQLRDWGLPAVGIAAEADAGAVLERAFTSMLPEPPPAVTTRSRIVAVTGPAGATGCTTVAVNFAAEVPSEALLVDADVIAPSVGFHLDLDSAAGGILAACRMGEQARLDASALVAMAHEAAPGLRVVTGVPAPQRVGELRASGYEALLRAAATTAGTVVVDCGAFPAVPAETGALRAAVLCRADHVVVVARPTALGIRRLLDGYREVAAQAAGQVTVVWNGVPATRSGRASLRRLHAATASLRPAPRTAALPWDQAAAAAADARPGPLAVVARRSSLRAAVRLLAEQLSVGNEEQGPSVYGYEGPCS